MSGNDDTIRCRLYESKPKKIVRTEIHQKFRMTNACEMKMVAVGMKERSKLREIWNLNFEEQMVEMKTSH